MSDSERPESAADPASRRALATLDSQLLRVTIMVATCAMGLVLMVLVWLILPAFDSDMGERFSVLPPSGAILALIGYELLVRLIIKRKIARSRAMSPSLWYVNAFVEVSLATLILCSTYSVFRSPIHMLTAPAFGFYFALIILTTLRLDRNQSIFTGCAAAVQYFAVAAYVVATTPRPPGADPLLWSPAYYGLMVAALLVAAIGAGFVAQEIRRRTFRVMAERDRRAEVVRVFGQFIAPELVTEILEKGADLSSRRRYLCVMFLDIRGFSGFAETRDPVEVVDYINTLFRFMADIVRRHHGMIHQFQGDGFLAFFGAPLSRGNDCQNALSAAFELLDKVDVEVANGRIPPTRIGIGLHAGDVVVGTIGSSVHREFAATGDVVNLASRIEGLNKRYHSRLLVSRDVLENADIGDREVRDLGVVEIRGRTGGVHLCQLV